MSEFAEAPFAATPGDFELGRKALLEITPADTIGAPAGSIDEGDGVVSVYFDVAMLGYVGWRWTTSIAHVEGSEPTVLETEMTPGDGALLSPDWVPWADRLADYKETQAGLVAEEGASDDDDDFDDDDVNDDDDALLHSGDLDGVDIDSLEDDDSDDDDSDDSDDDDDFDGSVPAAPVGVDEADEAEPEADDARPDPPAVTRGKQRGKKKQQADKAD